MSRTFLNTLFIYSIRRTAELNVYRSSRKPTIYLESSHAINDGYCMTQSTIIDAMLFVRFVLAGCTIFEANQITEELKGN